MAEHVPAGKSPITKPGGYHQSDKTISGNGTLTIFKINDSAADQLYVNGTVSVSSFDIMIDGTDYNESIDTTVQDATHLYVKNTNSSDVFGDINIDFEATFE